jgi:hypothetical protein
VNSTAAWSVMGLTGQGSKLSFPENLAAVAKRIAVQRDAPGYRHRD